MNADNQGSRSNLRDKAAVPGGKADIEVCHACVLQAPKRSLEHETRPL